MGCTMFFVCMSLHPELNDKIDVMIALAPAVSMAKSTAPLILSQGPIAEQVKVLQHHATNEIFSQLITWVFHILQFFLELIGVRAYQPVDSPWHNLRKRYCGPNLFLRYSLCQNTLFSTSGDDYYAIDLVRYLQLYMENSNLIRWRLRIAKFRVKSLKTTFVVYFERICYQLLMVTIRRELQLARLFITRRTTWLVYNKRHLVWPFNDVFLIPGETFQRYDFGHGENQLRYGQKTPPTYDLSKVTCDVIILWAQSDRVIYYARHNIINV